MLLSNRLSLSVSLWSVSHRASSADAVAAERVGLLSAAHHYALHGPAAGLLDVPAPQAALWTRGHQRGRSPRRSCVSLRCNTSLSAGFTLISHICSQCFNSYSSFPVSSVCFFCSLAPPSGSFDSII